MQAAHPLSGLCPRVGERLFRWDRRAAAPAPESNGGDRGNHADVRDEGFCGRSESAAETAQYCRVGRQRVRAAQLVELEQVLGLAQEPVRLREVLGVGAADVPAVGEGGKRGERSGDAEPLVVAAVHELQ